MSKMPVFPPIVEDMIYINISDIGKEKALRAGEKAFFELPVWIGDTKIGYWNCFSHCEIRYTFATISGNINGKYFEKTFHLDSRRSNLAGKTIKRESFVYYFVCPFTGKNCRKLYLFNGVFGCREYFKPMYRRQTRSKTQISWELIFGLLEKIDAATKEISSRKIKRTYKGKLTKAWKRQLKKIGDLENDYILQMGKVSDLTFKETTRVEKTLGGFRTIETKRLPLNDPWKDKLPDWDLPDLDKLKSPQS